MQEQHFEDLKHVFTDELIADQAKKATKILDQLVEGNKLLSLPEDEFQCLLAFRKWKSSSDRATGVFHWRVRGKRRGE
jgi:hypothetical protein